MNRAEEVGLSELQVQVFHLAIGAIQQVLGGELLALVMQAEDGLFVQMRPGNEREISKCLAELDWGATVLLAQEHFP